MDLKKNLLVKSDQRGAEKKWKVLKFAADKSDTES